MKIAALYGPSSASTQAWAVERFRFGFCLQKPEQVWAKPIAILAKEYGISDVGFAKICKKLNVPRPYRGRIGS